ncbi:MAG: branched-chain amino acid ABC transporter permease [Methylobacteriaceae bacterium]|nr:branched-chain amino acid ABC transporter permease [Methylobacteriaceae bacterium]
MSAAPSATLAAAPASARPTRSRSPVLPITIGAVLVIAAGFAVPAWLLTILLFALFRAMVVLGLIVLLRAGLVSFGQALYFAVGAYAVGFLSRAGVNDALVRVLAGALAAGALGLVLGFLLRRYRGIFFAMLSLAFSMILYGLLVKSESLGSTDGFAIHATTYAGYAPDRSSERFALLVLSSVVAWAGAIAVALYLRGTLGRLAEAVRDNEIRVEYLGASVAMAVHVKYVIAATLAGVGGALAAMVIGHVDPAMAYWTNSGEFVFVMILSGSGSVFAPFLGALVFELIHAVATHYSPGAWRIILGSALLAAIMFVPGGLWSLMPKARRS